MAEFAEISTHQAAGLMSNRATLVLDARDAHSYKNGHIDGAMQAHEGLVQHLINRGETERPILVYCYHGNKSKDVALLFGRAGFSAFSMKGGYTAWKKRSALYSPAPYSSSTSAWLLECGFEERALNTVVEHQTTPLMLACRQGQIHAAEELLTAGADPHRMDAFGNTALWAACFGNYPALIERLVIAGAALDHQNAEGVSALIYAASAGKAAAVKTLLALGADPTLKTRDDFTALDLSSTREILTLLRNCDRRLV